MQNVQVSQISESVRHI